MGDSLIFMGNPTILNICQPLEELVSSSSTQFQHYWIVPPCEAGFLVVAAVKDKYNLKISVEFGMKRAVSSQVVPN